MVKIPYNGADTLQRRKVSTQEPEEYQAIIQDRSTIQLGDLGYLLVFKNISPGTNRKELVKAPQGQISTILGPAMFMSPTPSIPTHEYLKYILYPATHGGSTCSVFLGHRRGTGNAVVVKKIKRTSSTSNSITTEIKVVRKLDHVSIILLRSCADYIKPNICHLVNVLHYDASSNFSHANRCHEMALMFQPAGGISVIEMISSWREMNNADVFVHDTIRQVAAGLAYVHSKSIIHCDIKPDNLAYVAYDPVHAIIIDFGASIMAATSVNYMKGTVMYLAPEVLQLKELKKDDPMQPYSFPADLWSLGVTLLDFLKGQRMGKILGHSACKDLMPKELVTVVEKLTKDLKLRKLTLSLLEWEPERRLTAPEAEDYLRPDSVVKDEIVKIKLTSFDKSEKKRRKTAT